MDDGGTKPEDISSREHPADGPDAPPLEPIDQLTARALGNYHRAAQHEWDERWSGVIGEDKV